MFKSPRPASLLRSTAMAVCMWMAGAAAALRRGQQQGRTGFGQRRVQHHLRGETRDAIRRQAMLALEILHCDDQGLIVHIRWLGAAGVAPPPRRRV